MATLSCSASNCLHNSGGLCGANTINVSGSNAHTSISTQCDTFVERGIKSSLENVGNVNATGYMKQFVSGPSSIEMTPSVRCEAGNCRYNENYNCQASNVQVEGPGALSSSRTFCETFVE